jgi:hypothetical protein
LISIKILIIKLFIYYFIFINKENIIKKVRVNFMGIGDWGLGIGDWGLGIGDWAQSPIPNPQSPIPIDILIKSKYIISIFK